MTDYINRVEADAEPKWNCTANFIAEQLERLKDMTDEEVAEWVTDSPFDRKRR